MSQFMSLDYFEGEALDLTRWLCAFETRPAAELLLLGVKLLGARGGTDWALEWWGLLWCR